MKTLLLHVSDGPRTTTLEFRSFPVRLGRDPAAHCRLEFPFVSRRHARIDLREGRLTVSDEGSRMGTWVDGGARRLEPGAAVDLESTGNEMCIGLLVVRAEVRDEPDAVDAQAGDTDVGTNVRTSYYADANIDPSALDAGALEEALVEALAEHLRASQVLADVLRQAATCGPAQIERLARLVVESDPEWDGHAAVRQFVALSGLRPESRRTDATALRVLQEFSSYYVPYAPPLSGTEAVMSFLARLDTVLGVLLEGTASLRYGYQCEAGSLPPGVPNREDLAAGLLDWTNNGGAVERLRRDFTRMLVHHSRLVGEATVGLARILERLTPSSIEAEPRCRSKWGPWRYKARWLEFVRRVQVLERMRESALGPTFSNAAKALHGHRASEPRSHGAEAALDFVPA